MLYNYIKMHGTNNIKYASQRLVTQQSCKHTPVTTAIYVFKLRHSYMRHV